MDIALGLLFGVVTLYASTLSYTLRGYSRGRLADYLSEERQSIWFERLDRAQFELQTTASFLRLIAIIVMLTWMNLEYFGDTSVTLDWRTLLTPALSSLGILLVIALGVPHAVAGHAGEAILARSLSLLWGLRTLLYPVEKILAAIEFIVRRLLGKADHSDAETASRLEREILDAVSEGELHGAVDEEQKEFIKSVFELHETHVSEIMTPRTDMVAVPINATLEATRERIKEAGHSRIPVFEGSLDQIVGVLYAKDLIHLNKEEEFDLQKLKRIVPYVPETKPIDELLKQLRTERVHIAIVLDEYGGTAGLISIEDIIEELVGEIDDEYDPDEPPEISPIDADTLEVDARVHVDDVNERLSIKIPDDRDYDTIGGFVFSSLGKIPETGEELRYENVEIKVIDAEPRRINRLRIQVNRTIKPTENGHNGR